MPDDNVTITLRTPIQAHGEAITELSFRPPTSIDMIEVGSPVRLDIASSPPMVIHDEKKFALMMSRLGAVPPSSIASMHPLDFIEMEWRLTDFFVPKPGTI
jgi:hypothetical protein